MSEEILNKDFVYYELKELLLKYRIKINPNIKELNEDDI